jgi:hypothetical protein
MPSADDTARHFLPCVETDIKKTHLLRRYRKCVIAVDPSRAIAGCRACLSDRLIMVRTQEVENLVAKVENAVSVLGVGYPLSQLPIALELAFRAAKELGEFLGGQ